MLKETPQSLRVYFGLVAAYSLLLGIGGGVGAYVSTVTVPGFSLFAQELIPAFLNGVFGVLFVFISLKLPVLLSRKPVFIKNVLLANFAVSVGEFFINGMGPISLFGLLISALIYFYLVRAVSRLSAEPTQAESPRLSKFSNSAGNSIKVSMIANLIIALSYAPMIFIPTGTPIRPMGQAFLGFLLAFVCFIVALPLALKGFWEGRKKLSFIALLLSLSPLPFSILAMRCLAAICGLTLED